MKNPKWGVFFDFHTQPNAHDVGAKFDCEAVADKLAACGVDFIVFPARCNLGMAYYNTAIGTRHPTLRFDLLGTLVEACNRRNIAVSAYFNVSLSHDEGLKHRDWLTLSPEGYVYRPDRMNNFFRSMCFNTPYAEQLLSMVKEVAEAYPVAGFFFDCMVVRPCIGYECIEEMKQLHMDPEDPEARYLFGRKSLYRMAERLAQTVRGANPELLLYFNGIPFADQRHTGNYLEYESLGRAVYEGLPVTAHYARQFDCPVLNMSGRFHRSWGDFGGLRTPDSLEFDVAVGLANGMRSSVGDHFHPRGDMPVATLELIGRVYRKFQVYEPFLEGAKAVTEIAVLTPQCTFGYNRADSAPYLFALYGVTRLLDEGHQQFDILTPDMDFSAYACVILSEEMRVDAELAARLEGYLAQGGKLISAYHGGLSTEQDAFALPASWGARFAGASPHDPAYLRVDPGICAEFPDLPLTLYRQGSSVYPEAGTLSAGELVRPYCNFHWDGEHGNFYTPPDVATGEAGITATGQVIHFSHPIFTSYYEDAQPQLLSLFTALLKRLLPEPMLDIPDLPRYCRATVTRQTGRTMIHLMNYHPDSPAKEVVLVAPPVELRHLTIRWRTPQAPRRVYSAATGRELPFRQSDIYCEIPDFAFNGYTILVLEDATQ